MNTRISAEHLKFDLEEKLSEFEDILCQIHNPNPAKFKVEGCLIQIRQAIELINQTDMGEDNENT